MVSTSCDGSGLALPLFMQPLTTSLLAFGLLAGCVATDEGRPVDDGELDSRSGGKADGQSCELGQLSASAYYDLFGYHELSDWAHHYRVGLSWDLVATLDNGDSVDLNVYFLPGSRVIVEYSELHSLNDGQSEVLNETVIVTRAKIDARTRALTIEGVGTGTPITVANPRGGCTPGISLELTRDQRSPGLVGDFTTVLTGTTTAYVVDPDHLDQVPSETARRYFQEDVASGKIKVVRY